MTTTAPVLAEVSADDGEDCGRAFVDDIRQPRDEVLLEHGAGDLKLYEKLLSDPIVRSTFWQRRVAVVARETKVEPGGPTTQDKMAAESLEAQLKALAWDRTTLRMLNGVHYGRAHAECMWETDGREIRLARAKVRRARRFRFGIDGSLRLMRAELGGSGERMPEQKFWSCTFGAEDDDDPNGRGLGHWFYWPVWFKRNAVRFWALFLERFSSPVPIATVPAGMSDTERGKVLDLLDSIRNGGKGVKSGGITIDFEQAVRDSGGDYLKFIELMDKWITLVALTETMTTEDGSSRAQGEVHERMGILVSQVDSDLLTESFMNGPGRWLTEWNYPGAALPILYRDFASSKDLLALATRDKAIIDLGYRPTKEKMQETYGEGYEPIAAAAPVLAPVDDGPEDETPEPKEVPEAAPPPVVEEDLPEIPLTATDAASIFTVDEARKALKRGPMPGGAGTITIAQFQAKNATVIAAANAATSGEAPPLSAPANASPPDANASAFAEPSLEAQAAQKILGDEGWRRVVGPEADAVAKVLAEAKDLKDAKAKLALLATSEPTGELVESLARSMFAARLEANAELGDEDTADGD